MIIYVNNKTVQIVAQTTVLSLIQNQGFKPAKSAVWLNDKQLLLAEYPTTLLHANDSVKMIPLLGGG